MLLREASDSGPVSQVALEGLEENCPILREAQFYTRPGSADLLKRARTGETKAKITRSLNESNSAMPPTPVYDPVTKKIVSFDAKVDVTIEDRNDDLATELAEQTRLESEEASWVLQEMFFEGDDASDSEDFDGMRQIVDAGQVYTDGLLVPAGSSDSNRQAMQLALEKFKQNVARVRGGATHVYMNEFLKMRWVSVAKELGYHSKTVDEFGDEIDRIGNVIIRGAGYKENGNTLLDFTEAGGTTSMFFARWGERKDLTLLTSVGVKGRYSGQSGNFLVNNVNLDAVLHLQNAYALVQSTAWKIVQL